MLSFILYALILICLVYWIERPGPLVSNSLIIKNPADELENWLKKFSWGNRHELQIQGRLPVYKFYTEIVELLLNIARRFGGSYQESIIYLREGLQADRQSEKKLREMIIGAWIQMGLMVLLTWLFIGGALALTEVRIGVIKMILISFWQGIGLFTLPFLLKYFRRRYFEDIGTLWKILYILKSLVKVPLSRTEVMTLAGVSAIKKINQASLLHIVDKLKETCQKALHQGGSYEEEVHALMEELRFQEKWSFELFEKRLAMIKLALMAIFFLPSYLAFIFLLLNDLLTLM